MPAVNGRMELTSLERAILSWIAERHPEFAQALGNVAAIRREYSDAGSYTYLSELGRVGETKRVDGPQIESPCLPHSAGSLLWLSGNVPDCLEVYTHADKLPVDLDEFALSEAPADMLQPTRVAAPNGQRELARTGPRG